LKFVDYFTIMDDLIFASSCDKDNYNINELCNFNVNKFVEKVELITHNIPGSDQKTQLLHIYLR